MEELITTATTDEEYEDINRRRKWINQKRWYIQDLSEEQVERDKEKEAIYLELRQIREQYQFDFNNNKRWE